MKTIPSELQDLVYWSIKILGEEIKKEYGISTFNKIEKIRKTMKSIRATEFAETSKVLNKELATLNKESDENLLTIVRSYSLMLELINRCESAYRAHRLNAHGQDKKITNHPHAIIFVFTAHPTEAKSPESLFIFQKIYETLKMSLQFGKIESEKHLRYLLSLSLKVSMSRSEKPTVADEAEHLYSFVLNRDILNQQVQFHQQNVIVHFRSWVGGDKDGHPGVNEKTLLMSLKASRKYLIQWIEDKINSASNDIQSLHMSEKYQLKKNISALSKQLKKLADIKENDGEQVKLFTKKTLEFIELKKQQTKLESPYLEDVKSLLWLYPALVMPLEIREDSSIVHEAINHTTESITKMIKLLAKISKGFDPKWYVRGFVLSQVESAADIIAGHNLVNKYLPNPGIPVVPLFESRHALENSIQILKELFTLDKTIIKRHKDFWHSRFEVMVGYSDSSKESGVFASRYLISKTLYDIDNYFSKIKLAPVFFHGSGGSIERGGGSVEEQTAWWPNSAINIFKATIQGEMIARNFTSHEIMKGQINSILSQTGLKNKAASINHKLLQTFAIKTAEAYQSAISDEVFFENILKATPYDYLDVLKIGSRPTKRQTSGRKLRAIPWVLCWTQSRILFPTWWGVGSTYSSLTSSQKDELRLIYKKNPLFSSYLKNLGFTMRKIELPIWKLYLERTTIQKADIQKIFDKFESEYQLTIKMIQEITGENNLLWHRPWLGQSIHFRSTMIHPINLVQIIALKRNNEVLLRETVTGIASGMMTTG